jgi:hypothetical protein
MRVKERPSNVLRRLGFCARAFLMLRWSYPPLKNMFTDPRTAPTVPGIAPSL